MIDEEKQLVKVTQHSSFFVYPKSKNEKFTHKTINTINFREDKSEVSLSIHSFNINGKSVKPTLSEEIIDNKKLKTSYEVILQGEDSYKFETQIDKTYSLLDDNAIGTTKDFLIHDFNLKLHIKGGIEIDFYN
jgi:hypothetical protein